MSSAPLVDAGVMPEDPAGFLPATYLPLTATVQGVSLQMQATVLHRQGLSADTTVGSWEFPAVDGLPLGCM